MEPRRQKLTVSEAAVEAPVAEEQEPVLEDVAEVAAPEAETSEPREGDQAETAAKEESPR